MVCKKKKELLLGIKKEMEHAGLFPKNLRLSMAERIAKDHIRESPCYYSKGLIPMERRLKKK
ncbi:unnamed protein product [marine sediment metagenome]|uniref:Uncharacterized protein n=1 Tax=marine sediment metagenome TaxID=412755 RepID=X0T677_9ZZZZ